MHKQIKLLIVFLLFFICLFVKIHAQTFNFRHFNINDGLPSSEVYQVLQDTKGYIWVATNFGVSRFDGYSFKNFDNKDGLPDNTILELYEDYKGRVWFISNSAQLSYFEKGKIIKYPYNQKLIETIKDRPAITYKSFYVDSLNNIHIGIYGKGTFKITPKGTIYKPYFISPDKIKSQMLYIDKNNIGHFEAHLSLNISIVKNLDTVFIPFSSLCDSKYASGLRLYCYNKAEQLLLFYHEFIFQITSFKHRQVKKIDFKFPIISTLFDNSKQLWIGTSKNGVFLFPNGDISAKATMHFLQNESITSILEDKEHGFWFSTLNNGVFYIPSDKFSSYLINHGLSENIQIAVTSDANENIITTSGINNNINLIKDSITFKKILSSDEIIYSILYKKSDNTFWVGTNKGLFELNYNNFSVLNSYKLINQIFTVNEIIESSDNQIWAATNKGVFKIENNQLKQFSNSNPFFRIFSITEDLNKNIWMGTNEGLFVLQNEKIIYKGDLHKNLKNKITSVKFCKSDSSLWIATKGNGILIVKNNKVTELSVNNGLSSTFATSLFIDKNIIWAGTNNGLNKIRYNLSLTNNKFQIEHYNQIKGIVSNEINNVYVLNNTVFVLTNMGISTFNYTEIKPNSTPPPVYIKGIKILTNDTLITNHYDLKYNQNFLTIEFNGLTYKNPGKVKFKYKLSGLNDEWQFTNSPVIQYQYIPPGDYHFELFAINEDGIQSKYPASFSLTIFSPFWKTWWFIAISILVFIGIVFAIYKFRLQEIKNRQKLKDELNRYIQQALTKQMNPHFIFNSLNSIQNYILENDKRQSSKYLSKFAKLMRLILENSQNPSISLKQELSAIGLYLELEAMRFNGKFSYTINIDETVDQNIEIPALIIQPYVENAIWHGIMHNPEKYGELKIDLYSDQNFLQCVITDNGIGRKKSAEINALKRKNHKSFGTHITEKRLQAYNSLYSTKVDIDFVDLYDETDKPKGTTVKIKIHIKNYEQRFKNNLN